MSRLSVADDISIETIPGPNGMVGQAIFLGAHTTRTERWRNVLAIVVTGNGMQAVMSTEQAAAWMYQDIRKRRKKSEELP